MQDIMEGKDYGQLKDLISDRSRWRQDLANEKECQKPVGNSRRVNRETEKTSVIQ